jgi:hypothetical protein
MLLVHITETGDNNAIEIVTGTDSTAAVANTSGSNDTSAATAVAPIQSWEVMLEG